MAYSFDFIFGSDAHAGRAARRTPDGTEYGHKGFVVIVEIMTGQYEELDADSAEHAGILARSWVDNKIAQTASVWAVKPDGKLAGKKPIEIVAPLIDFDID